VLKITALRIRSLQWRPNSKGVAMKLPEYDDRPQAGETLYSPPGRDTEDAKMTFLIIFGVLCLIGYFYFGLGGLLDIAVSFLRAILN
jgi:hypothetical protein